MRLSTLHIEPHRIKPDTRKEYFVPLEGIIFWRIVVDSKEITDRALPFFPDEDYIELSADIEVPWHSEGNNYVRVRYSDQHVFWFGIDTIYEIQADRSDFSKTDLLHAFDRAHYIQTVNQHYSTVRPDSVANQPPRLDLSWTVFEPAELKSYLMGHLPRPEDALYRTLANHYDPTGEFLLRRLLRTMRETPNYLQITDAPEKYLTLNIGLDLPEFTECILHIGKRGDDFIVRFEQYPAFPCWLSSAAFGKAFRDEPFAMDLNPK